VDGDQLREIIRERFLGGDTTIPLEAGTLLLEEGICDSLGLVQLALELERRIPGLKIRDPEINRQNLGSITAIVAFLAKKK
jgi:acyl carrier protein